MEERVAGNHTIKDRCDCPALVPMTRLNEARRQWHRTLLICQPRPANNLNRGWQSRGSAGTSAIRCIAVTHLNCRLSSPGPAPWPPCAPAAHRAAEPAPPAPRPSSKPCSIQNLLWCALSARAPLARYARQVRHFRFSNAHSFRVGVRSIALAS